MKSCRRQQVKYHAEGKENMSGGRGEHDKGTDRTHSGEGRGEE